MHRSYKVKDGPITVGQLRKLERLTTNLNTCSTVAGKASLSQDLHGTIQAMIQQAKKEEQKKRDPLWWADETRGEPRPFDVEVCRTGVGHITLSVTATSQREACETALDVAGNESFSDKSSDYEVTSVS